MHKMPFRSAGFWKLGSCGTRDAGANVHKAAGSLAHMAEPNSLHSILSAMDKPVKASVVKEIVNYMKTMPTEHEALVIQCAEHLEKAQSLGAVLAVVHALNEGEFLLKHRDEDDPFGPLSKEFEQLMSESQPKKDGAALALHGDAAAET